MTSKIWITRAELSQMVREASHGVDTETRPKGPGLMDRIKGMFGSGKEKGGFEDAPIHWSPQQKEKFHRSRAIGTRDRAKQYAKMFTDANQTGDEKKRAYAKKMHAFYSNASNAHEKALRGSK